MDYYMVWDNFYNRLKLEYKKYGKLIIAYDFDDTVFNYHNNKEMSNEDIIGLLRDWKDYGYLICFTSRPDLKGVTDYLEQREIPYNSINKNMPGLPFGNNEKLYYNVLIDDRAGMSWAYIALETLLKEIKNGKIE